MNHLLHIWPGRQALAQAQAEQARLAPGGFLLAEPAFTLDNFLPALLQSLDQADAPGQISDLAGALLTQRLLADHPDHAEAFSGLRAGWRLPRRLWRLLVEIKAAGLGPADLRALNHEGLAGLLERYNLALAEVGLADQADGLTALIQAMNNGRTPRLLHECAGVVVHDVLWLRTLDMRLLGGLSTCAPVTVEFCLTPGLGARGPMAALLEHTAGYLERGGGNLLVHWRDMSTGHGPLAGLAMALLGGDADPPDPGAALELWRAAGRYGEVEALLCRAAELTAGGVDPRRIAVVFPELDIHGQMAVDVAKRLELPLDYRSEGPLAASPLVLAVLGLLELPGLDYERQALSAVWHSPYMGPALARLAGLERAPRAEGLLAAAGYIDARQTPPQARLAGEEGVALAKACVWLMERLRPLARRQGLPEFVGAALALLAELNLGAVVLAEPSRPEFIARDLAALAALEDALAQLGRAAESVKQGQAMSPGRLLSLLRQALRLQSAPGPGGQRGGVRLLRLDQAMGLRLEYVLAGGLDLGQFPQKPQAPNMLSSQERLALGQKAGLPVWRTDDEEYAGQMLRLCWLLASAGRGAVLSCSAADGQGASQEPAFFLREATRLLQRRLPEPRGGVYGQGPGLATAVDAQGLLSGLSHGLLRRRGRADLAQAALHHWLGLDAGLARRWRRLADLAAIERRRLWLDLLPGGRRQELADEYGGRLRSPRAQALLAEVLAQPAWRTLAPTQLEAMAACPMAWFFGRLLGVGALDEPGLALAGRDEGQMVHAALARFFAPEAFDPRWDREARRVRLEDCLERAWAEAAKKQASHGFARRWRKLAVRELLAATLERMWSALEGGWRPVAVEERIDDWGLSLDVGAGPALVLGGVLDRLDAGQEDGRQALRVVDYKHAANPGLYKPQANKERWFVDAFQLPLYMAAAAKQRPAQVALGQIVCTKNPEKGVIQAREELPSDFFAESRDERARIAQNGGANLYNAVAALWARVSAGQLSASPAKAACEHCDFGTICRAKASPTAEQGDGA